MLEGREWSYVRDCLESGWISSRGEYVERFEQSWAEYCGMKHGIAVSSGTAALQVAVDALRLKPGDEVIVPGFTIISCVLAVIRTGATPVLVDCDPDTYCIDVDQAAAAVNPRTQAIMPVHVYGHPAAMDPVLDLAERHGLAIVEDAAQAHGSEYLSRRARARTWRRCGGFGTLSTFSFYANKLVTTGEGGMVLTNDASLAQRCRSLRNLCFRPRRFEHAELGYNFRFTNVQAAIGLAQLERMPEILRRKREIGATYQRSLGRLTGIKLQARSERTRTNCWMNALVLGDRVRIDARALASRLDAHGVETRPFFMGLHQQPALRRRGLFPDLRLPVTERLHKRGLYLPSGLTLRKTHVGRVVEALKECLA